MSSNNASSQRRPENQGSYVANYGIELQWPAHIIAAKPPASSETQQQSASSQAQTRPPPPKTSNELLQHRLLEAGILYDVLVSLGDTAASLQHFVSDLERTGCFNSVHVEIGNTNTSSPQQKEDDQQQTDSYSSSTYSASPQKQQQQQQQQELRVYLDEKKWYRLHLGAGLKTNDSWSALNGASSSGLLSGSEALQQSTQVEASFGLRNLTGCLDQTDFNYTVDLKQTASFLARHERPLYTFLPPHSPGNLRNTLLLMPNGSRWSSSTQLSVQTHDYEWMRSYKEFSRVASWRISNQHSLLPQNNAAPLAQAPEQQHLLPQALPGPTGEIGTYYGLEWTSMIRDIVPRRSSTDYFCMQASPQVAAQAGSTVKHSLTGLVRCRSLSSSSSSGDGSNKNNVGGHALVEVAVPPGDVQFVKYHAGLQGRWPLLKSSANNNDDDTDTDDGLTLHGSFQTGLLHPLIHSGKQNHRQRQHHPPTLSDRFYVGGPAGQFRGFLPGGIGPRARSAAGGKSLLSPGGDSLGGDFYYTATALLSAPLIPPTTSSGNASTAWPFRCFGFCTMGTCIGNVMQTPVSSILKSSRCSVGVGIATTAAGTGLPRIELTYAWPLRYGPHDARRNFQWSIGISID